MLGCGISAFTEQDAICILNDRIFQEVGSMDIESLIADVDVSSLDSGHVLPNLGDVTARGVWFPLGY